MDAGPVAQIIVDTSGALSIANERARQLFHLTLRDIGRPLQDLEVSYKPVELRSIIEQALNERKTILVKDIEWKVSSGELGFYNLQVAPVTDAVENLLGTAITFADVTLSRQLQTELQHYNQELETAYEELQSTNEELQTTNEELQSTVEELETTNEELQSTNEELETMNEELQSTNEELETINTELSVRTNELNRVNTFIRSILSSLRDGVVVLDPEMMVLAWNARSEDLWGLREPEVIGKHFLNLDIGLPVEKLRPAIRECLQGDGNGAQELTVSATNRRGKAIDCVVTCTPLNGYDSKVLGTILLTEERAAKP
jgi:two-component system CheB/CheR fusion protein